MFILGWLVILLVRANEWFVIPEGVSLIVGILAIIEAAFYAIVILINIITFVRIGRKF